MAADWMTRFVPDEPEKTSKKDDWMTRFVPDKTPVEKIAASAPIRFTLGAQRGTAAPFVEAGNILNRLLSKVPGINIPQIKQMPRQVGTAGRAGEIAGALGGFAGLGEIASPLAAMTGMAGAPALANIGTAAGYGALMSPQDRGKGALLGASLGTAGEALPFGVGLAAKGIKALKPKDLTQSIMEYLSKGRNLEENAQSMQQDIKQAYNEHAVAGSTLYNSFLNAAGKDTHIFGDQGKDVIQKKIGQGVPQERLFANTLTPKEAQYSTMTDGEDELLGSPVLRKLNQKYQGEPSLNNAHRLYKQYRKNITTLLSKQQKGTMSETERDSLDFYFGARNSLQNDIGNFLTKNNPSAGETFSNANKYWRQNVAPYKEKSGIKNLVFEKDVTPSAITNAFKNPSLDQQGHIQNIHSHLPENFGDKIIYSELGKLKNKTPENILSKIEDVKNKGFESYITPSLDTQLKALGTSVGRRKMAQKAIGGISGAAFYPLLRALGISPEAAFGIAAPLATVGYTTARPLIGKIAEGLPRTNGKIGAAAAATYEPIRQAILSQTLRGGQ